MISGKELRVGTHIQEGKIWYLETDEDGSYFYKADSFGSMATPIPLTEEWAMRFGYECLLEMAVGMSDNKYKAEITVDQLRSMAVHEAQNLNLYLTGEELTLKEQE